MIENEIVSLKETKDFNYIYELVSQDKYWQISKRELSETIKKYNYQIWEVFHKEVKVGIVCIHYRSELGWCLDGYRDHRIKIDKISCSIEAGKLITEYMLNKTDNLFTFHPKANKGASILCRKLGFEKIYNFKFRNNNNDFVLFARRK